MMANNDIPYHVKGSINKKETLRLDVNETPDPSKPWLKGTYLVTTTKLVPDYLTYFPEHGFKISRDRVELEFAPAIMGNARSKMLMLGLGVGSTKTTMNAKGINSPVVSLGTGILENPDAKVFVSICPRKYFLARILISLP